MFFSLDIVIFNGLPCQCSKDSLQDPKRVEDCTLTSHFRHFDRSEGRDVRMIFRQVACMGCPRESHIVHRAPSGHRSTWFSAMNCTGHKCYPHKKGGTKSSGALIPTKSNSIKPLIFPCISYSDLLFLGGPWRQPLPPGRESIPGVLFVKLSPSWSWQQCVEAKTHPIPVFFNGSQRCVNPFLK